MWLPWRGFKRLALSGMFFCLMAHFLFAQSPQAGTRYALLIGINDYDYLSDLEYCATDIQGLQKQLLKSGFDENRVYMMHEEVEDRRLLPSKTAIERLLKMVTNLAQKGDTILVAFSGHGLHLGEESFFCPLDAHPEEKSTLLSVKWVYEQLEQCSAGQKLLIVDACRNRLELPGRRSVLGNSPQGLMNTIQAPPQGILTLTSCDIGEFAMEAEDLSHGVFTHFLLEGLSGQADMNQDGEIGILEIFAYVNRQTKDYVGKNFFELQQPTLRGTINGDFVVATVSGTSAESNDKVLPELNVPSREDSMEVQAKEVSTSSAKTDLQQFTDRYGLNPRDQTFVAELQRFEEASFEEWKQQALAGDTAAQTLYAACLETGVFTDKNVVDALKWYQTAAEQGESFAQYRYARMHHQNPHPEIGMDWELARTWYQKAVDQGSCFAQHNLGYLYFFGASFVQDDQGEYIEDKEKGLALLQMAAAQNFGHSEIRLGDIYLVGYGKIEQDQSEGLRWIQRAIDHGHLPALTYLGQVYLNGLGGVEQDVEKGLELIHSAADQGGTDALINLAYYHEYGRHVEKDLSKALQYTRQAAELNSWNAQYKLGQFYEKGIEVSQSYAEAAKWYRLVAVHDYAAAQYALGLLYQTGRGVSQDYQEAIKWYRLSARLKYREAYYSLSYMYSNGWGVERDLQKAFDWCLKAAEKDQWAAVYRMGRYYEEGEIVSKDYLEALKWYRRAAHLNYAPAAYRVGVLFENGWGVNKDLAEAKKWYQQAADKGYSMAKDRLKELSSD
ncbi:Hypothetical protein PBC10988_36910 [Planctomycetales bacterium 10988]|nr:Hypothetical protein PBC10988_36910 [Planctomycetales bacterium 10988]